MKHKRTLLIFILLLLISTIYFENETLSRGVYDFESDKLPAAFSGFKIISISDFHSSNSVPLRAAILKTAKAEQPDLIFLTGDFFDSGSPNTESALSFAEELCSYAPVYFVSGNHEARLQNFSELAEMLSERGVIIADEKKFSVNRGNSSIFIYGMNDPSFKESFLPEPADGFSILLSHRPELFEKYVNSHFNLCFSGHAHGGGIRLPFIGGIIAPNQGFFPKYQNGLYKENETAMIVSRGVGNSILPFRFLNRPEIIITTLRNGS